MGSQLPTSLKPPSRTFVLLMIYGNLHVLQSLPGPTKVRVAPKVVPETKDIMRADNTPHMSTAVSKITRRTRLIITPRRGKSLHIIVETSAEAAVFNLAKLRVCKQPLRFSRHSHIFRILRSPDDILWMKKHSCLSTLDSHRTRLHFVHIYPRFGSPLL